MSDQVVDVRAAARREAEKRAPEIPVRIIRDHETNEFREFGRDAFVGGAQWAAEQLPSGREIEVVIARFWDEHDTPEDVAEAVLALIRSRYELVKGAVDE